MEMWGNAEFPSLEALRVVIVERLKAADLPQTYKRSLRYPSSRCKRRHLLVVQVADIKKRCLRHPRGKRTENATPHSEL